MASNADALEGDVKRTLKGRRGEVIPRVRRRLGFSRMEVLMDEGWLSAGADFDRAMLKRLPRTLSPPIESQRDIEQCVLSWLRTATGRGLRTSLSDKARKIFHWILLC